VVENGCIRQDSTIRKTVTQDRNKEIIDNGVLGATFLTKKVENVMRYRGL
jgi:hypothetical protein